MKKLVKNGVEFKGGKRYLSLIETNDLFKSYAFDEACKVVKDIANAKFNESIDLSYKLNIKQKHTIRDVVVLPHSIGKTVRVLVFASGDKSCRSPGGRSRFCRRRRTCGKDIRRMARF